MTERPEINWQNELYEVRRLHMKKIERALFYGIFQPVEDNLPPLTWWQRLDCRLRSWWVMLNEPIVVHLGECQGEDD